MGGCVKCLDKVDTDNEGFEAVLLPELERDFEGEGGVSAAFILETAILGFQIVIVNMLVHSVHYNVGEDFICTIEKANRAPVVCVSGAPFFKYRSQVFFGSFFWD